MGNSEMVGRDQNERTYHIRLVETEEMSWPDSAQELVNLRRLVSQTHLRDVFKTGWAAFGLPHFPIEQPADLARIDGVVLEVEF